PYERKSVFDGQGEHQGGFVDLPNGESPNQSWFICFKRMNGPQSPMGRVDFLEPVQWGDDDWPVFGDAGKPVGQHAKPNVGKTYPITRPATSDDFSARTLGLQWQWNHNPVNDHWSLTERPGFLRLKALPADNLPGAHNTLTQKLWDSAGIIDVKLDLSGMADGQHAGLAFQFGHTFGNIGVTQQNGQRHMEWLKTDGPPVTTATLYLRETCQDTTAHFYYSFDGQSFTDSGAAFKLGFADWKGSRPALYSYGPAGYVDIDYLHYRYADTLDHATIMPITAAVGHADPSREVADASREDPSNSGR
ncbi:MAG TPA: hypothetical protein VHI52_05925, partial [Verrucomicrobiae bacterium]|nr:hypothetical protein [Verrucomicrobiae bacterium]